MTTGSDAPRTPAPSDPQGATGPTDAEDQKTGPRDSFGADPQGTIGDPDGTAGDVATPDGAARPEGARAASAVAADASAAAKVGDGPVGTADPTTPQRTSETAWESAAQNVPAETGPGERSLLEVVDVRTGMFGVDGTGDTSGFGGLVRTVAMPGPSERPYGGWFDEVVDVLGEVLAEGGSSLDAAVEKVVIDREEMTLHVRREHVVAVCQALRDDQDLRFELGLGVSGVHYPNETGRELHAVYMLRSITHGRFLRLEVAVPDADPHIPSSVGVYPGHDWHERETWDFFGIIFDGHPGLARIEMPDDWPGHPQRKDYPLGGIPVEYKGASIPPPDERRSYS